MSQVLHVLRLTRWELFKLQRRRLPWVLLGIAVAISQLFLWGAYFTYHNSAIRRRLGQPVQLDHFRDRHGGRPRSARIR